jgi:hypothetical protein
MFTIKHTYRVGWATPALEDDIHVRASGASEVYCLLLFVLDNIASEDDSHARLSERSERRRLFYGGSSTARNYRRRCQTEYLHVRPSGARESVSRCQSDNIPPEDGT